MPEHMPADTVQMQLVRRYSRILREKQAEYRGPRIGARERKVAQQAAQQARTVAQPAARTAIDAVRPSGA